MTQSNRVLDSGGTLKLPGEADPDFARVVHEYLSAFAYYKVKKDYAVRDQLYEWCATYMGEKYKDWFIYEGGAYDKVWAIQIRSPKHSTFFRMKWNDAIVKSFDKHPEM